MADDHPPDAPARSVAAPPTDCCVVGAGPAGLLLAALLGRRGRRVTLLERQPAFRATPAGVVLQPVTLRILEEAGVLEQIARRSLVLRGLEEYAHGRLVYELRYDALTGAPFPYALVAPLQVLRDVLLELLAGLPAVTLRMGATVTELPAAGPGRRAVRATVAGAAQLLTPDVVVAADGKFSAVRELAGIPATAEPFDELHLIMRVPMPGEWPPVVRVHTAPDFLFTIPAADRHLYLFWSTTREALDALRQGDVAALLDRITATEPRLRDPLRVVSGWDAAMQVAYHTVRAATWHRDNVVLLGDSAHGVHSFGGQGLNLALQDAALLAPVIDRYLGSREPHDLGRLEHLRKGYVDAFQRRQRHLLAQIAAAADGAGGSVYAADFPELALGQPELRTWPATAASSPIWTY